MKESKTFYDRKPKREIEDFSDILKQVGGWGPFQYLLMFAFFPFNIFLGYVSHSPILTLFTPPHWCKVPQLMNLTKEHRKLLAIPMKDGLYSNCRQYTVDWSQLSPENMNSPNSSWPTGECLTGWEYELDEYHTSAPAQFDWVCDKAWIPALSQSLLFAGAIPGMLSFGWISDQFGRLPSIMLSNSIALLGGVLLPFATSHIVFLSLFFLIGLSYNTFFYAPYILVMEYVETSKRTLVGNLGLALFLTLSGLYQPWVIKYLGDWKLFNWIMFSQIGLVFFAPFFLPESSRWLMVQGKVEKLLKVLKWIAKLNKRKLPDNFENDVMLLCQRQKEMVHSRPSSGYKDLFCKKKMCQITLLSMVLWMIISLVFDTTVRNVSNLNFNLYISFMVTIAMELPADLLSIVGLNWLGRRWSSFIPMFGCGVTMIACIWVAGNGQAQIVMFMLGRIFATYCMNVGFQFTVEVMPTDVRGKGLALVNAMAMASQMASPYIVYSVSMTNSIQVSYYPVNLWVYTWKPGLSFLYGMS